MLQRAEDIANHEMPSVDNNHPNSRKRLFVQSKHCLYIYETGVASVRPGSIAGTSFGLSKSSSFRKSGKNLSSLFHVSIHNFSWEGSSLGGTK